MQADARMGKFQGIVGVDLDGTEYTRGTEACGWLGRMPEGLGRARRSSLSPGCGMLEPELGPGDGGDAGWEYIVGVVCSMLHFSFNNPDYLHIKCSGVCQ